MSLPRKFPEHSRQSGPKPPQFGMEGSYHWHHYRTRWLKQHSKSSPEQPLSGYEWRTSARLTPKIPNVPRLDSNDHIVMEPIDFRVLSLPRRTTTTTSSTGPVEQHSGQGRMRSLLSLIPYQRSVSEPGAGSSTKQTAVRKVRLDEQEQNVPFVHGLLSSVSQRISRILSIKDEPDPENQVPGRRALSLLSLLSHSVTHSLNLSIQFKGLYWHGKRVNIAKASEIDNKQK